MNVQRRLGPPVYWGLRQLARSIATHYRARTISQLFRRYAASRGSSLGAQLTNLKDGRPFGPILANVS